MHDAFDRQSITGLILAGGQGSRMGGADKGWVDYRGHPLVAHVLARLAPQVGPLLISANRNLERYAAFAAPVLTDALPGYPGPLAGLHAGLSACTTPRLVCVPCDAPLFSADLVARLSAALEWAPAAYAVTRVRRHPIFLACKRGVKDDLESYLMAGERRVGNWLERIGALAVEFEDEAEFANFNQADDLTQPPPANDPAGSAR